MAALHLLEADVQLELLFGRQILLSHGTPDDAGVGGGLRLGLPPLEVLLYLPGAFLRLALRPLLRLALFLRLT